MPDFLSKGLGGMMPGGADDSGLSKEQAEEMEARMKTGGMTFDDFLMQVKVMQKAGASRCPRVLHPAAPWPLPSDGAHAWAACHDGHAFHGCRKRAAPERSFFEATFTPALAAGRTDANIMVTDARLQAACLIYGCRQHAGHDAEDAVRRRRPDFGRSTQGRREETQALRLLRGAHVRRGAHRPVAPAGRGELRSPPCLGSTLGASAHAPL